MVNVAEIVTNVHTKLKFGVTNNSVEAVLDVLKILKEEYLVCKDKTTPECTLKQYIAMKGLEQATNHVIGYKRVEEPDAQHECITISLDDLADYLGEPVTPAVKLLAETMASYTQGNSIFNYNSEKYHFNKSEQKVGIVV